MLIRLSYFKLWWYAIYKDEHLLQNGKEITT